MKKIIKGIIVTLIIMAIVIGVEIISFLSKQEQYEVIKNLQNNNFQNIEKLIERRIDGIQENYEQILVFIGLQTAITIIYSIDIGIKYKKAKGKIKKENFNMNFNNLLSPEKVSIIYHLKAKKYNVLLSVLLSLKERSFIDLKKENILINNIDMCTDYEKRFLYILINQEPYNNLEIGYEKIIENIKTNKNLLDEINSVNNDLLEELYENNIFEKDSMKEKRFSKIFAIVNSFMIILMLNFTGISAKMMFTINILILAIIYILYKKFLHKIIVYNNATNFPEDKKLKVLTICLILVYLLAIKIVLLNVDSIILYVNVLCNLSLLILGKKNQLTQKGVDEYNKILGLRNYMENNNECIKDNISYAVALGLQDKYERKIKNEAKDILKEIVLKYHL